MDNLLEKFRKDKDEVFKNEGWSPLTEEQKAKFDFNYAYNPCCAYNHNWRCPITPEENRLSIAIDAGEKKLIIVHKQM